MSTPYKPRPSSGPRRDDHRGPAGGGKKRYIRKKFCRFCAEKELREATRTLDVRKGGR